MCASLFDMMNIFCCVQFGILFWRRLVLLILFWRLLILLILFWRLLILLLLILFLLLILNDAFLCFDQIILFNNLKSLILDDLCLIKHDFFERLDLDTCSIQLLEDQI